MTDTKPKSTPNNKTRQITANTAAIIQRHLFATTHNMTFGGKRSEYTALGYEETLSYDIYLDRYERGGIAERLVEAHPRATWSGGATIVETHNVASETKFEKDVVKLFKRLDIWARLLRADILAGIGRYSVLLIGAKGDLESPLPKMSSIDDVLFITPLSESSATIGDLEEDATNRRFGLPKFYNISVGATKTAKKVHHSRIIHVAEGLLENDLFGKPRLRAVWNNLDDLTKVVGGGAEAAWKRMDPGMQLDLDPETEMGAEEEAALDDEIDYYQHGLSRVMRTRGVDLKLLASTVQSFGPNSNAIVTLISATTGIPHRILTGSERGELASTQDRNNWNDRIVERRQEFATTVINDFIDVLIASGALDDPGDYETIWVELDEMSDDRKAEMVKNLTQANKAQSEAEGSIVLTANELRKVVFKLDKLPESDKKVTQDDNNSVESPPDDSNNAVVDVDEVELD